MEAQNDAMPPDQRLYLPYGISFHHLDERRMHWLRAHDRLIRRVCFQALFTPADPERIRENVMHITLEPRWDDRNPERYFRIKDIRVVPFYMAKNKDPIPNKGFSGFKKERDAQEGRSLVRKVALKVDCPPMIQLFRHIELLPMDCDGQFWKDIFIAEVAGFRYNSPKVTDASGIST